MQRSLFLYFILLCFVTACKDMQTADEEGLQVKVGKEGLHQKEVVSALPRGLSSSDSLLFAESYIHRWVTDALIYQAAEKNLGDDEKKSIGLLVEEYRQSLMRYRYQEKMVRERLSANIKEDEKQGYYQENQDKFVLENNLVKGLFLKIPLNAPGLSDVKKWYKVQTSVSLEKIEKYSVQNAIIYDYFYDRWVDFSEVMENIPVKLTDPAQFLRTNRSLEAEDSSYCYLLNVAEYKLKGNVAPYDYAGSQIQEMLINQRKVDFLKSFEENLYNDAVRKGRVRFYEKK